MKPTGDTAFVVSVHYDDPNNRLLINLIWQGDHDISDFDLDRLGEVLNCETETADSGWVIIEPSDRLKIYLGELQPPFGPPVLEPSFRIAAGDTLPLRERPPAVSKRSIDFACFWHCVMDCVKERRLLTVVRCLGRNTRAPITETPRPTRLHRALV
jgi:hypothetical protein